MKTDSSIEFYRGNAVHAVLQRYKFSDEEKRIIQGAILAARKEKPNLTLIGEADTLLQEVAKTRDPIKSESVDVKAVAKAVGLASVPPAQKKWFSTWYWLLLPVLIIALGKSYDFGDQHMYKYHYEEAKYYCKEQGKLLPLSIADIEAAGYTMRTETSVWSEDGHLLTWIQGKIKSDGQNHHVVCVDVNGKADKLVY